MGGLLLGAAAPAEPGSARAVRGPDRGRVPPPQALRPQRFLGDPVSGVPAPRGQAQTNLRRGPMAPARQAAPGRQARGEDPGRGRLSPRETRMIRSLLATLLSASVLCATSMSPLARAQLPKGAAPQGDTTVIVQEVQFK